MSRRIVESIRDVPDAPTLIVHGITGHGALRAAWRLIRVVVSLAVLRLRRERCLIHINLASRGSTARKMPILFLARALRFPVVLHLHGARYREFFRGCPRLVRSVISAAFRAAVRVVVLGGHWASFVENEIGVPPERVERLPNAVPEVLPRSCRDASRVSIVFAGRVGERKGTADLVHALAMQEIRDLPWRLTILGDGELSAAERLIEEVGLADRIHLAGWRSEADVSEALAEADIFVLPSYAEGLPLALLEAMAARLAIVATPVGSIPEFVTDGENGRLVPPGDTSALAAALGELLRDSTQRHRLGSAAEATWAEAFSLPAYAARLNALYAEVLATP
jgi:glycosyltransferase involved in cell wall biosynthesis